jgi:membrane-bound lytic murein transglycosylase A
MQLMDFSTSSFIPFSRRILLVDLLLIVGCVLTVWMNSREAVAAVTIPYAAGVDNTISLRTGKPTERLMKPDEADLSVKEAKRRLPASVLYPTVPDTMPFIAFEAPMMQAMYEQVKYLYRSDVPRVGASGITKSEMLKTLELLQGIQYAHPEVMQQKFDFYQLNTDLKEDRVRMTGYYTPLVKATRHRDASHTVPMLRRPDGPIPSPEEIDNGALEGQGVAVAWLSSRKELSNAQLQGNCLVEYSDGKRQYFGFGGSVKGAGGSYVFFTPVDEQVLGCGTFPLTAGYSVAVDPRYIPIGSTLLAELPDLDASGHLKGYKYRVIFAQDRGGAIQTTRRMDLYCGVGQKGLDEAHKINRFGRLWLLLPKSK